MNHETSVPQDMIFYVPEILSQLIHGTEVIGTYETMLECTVKLAIKAHEVGAADLVCAALT